MVISVKLVQSQKAPFPISVTLSGIVIAFKLVQFAKALYPISVILSGIVIVVKLVQFLKAYATILVTLSGITTLSVQVVPSIKIPFTTTNGFSSCFSVNHGVPEKAESPILVTLSGIVIAVKLVQPEKAYSSIYSTLSGIVIDVKLVQ